MTESVTPINVTTDAWLDLVNRVNEIISILSTNIVSTGGSTTGNISVIGNISGNALFDDSVRVVNQNRTISTNNGLTGGGNLSANRTLGLTAATLATLDKANTALQTSDFTGKVGLKAKVDIVDINTTGTANTSTYLRGDGVWSAFPSTFVSMTTAQRDTMTTASPPVAGAMIYNTTAKVPQYWDGTAWKDMG